MPKIAIFPMSTVGIQQIDSFQKENELLNFRFGRFDIGDQYPSWCIVILYIPKPEIVGLQQKENQPQKDENDGHTSVGTSEKSSKDSK
jgi:hypothetical protein